MRKTASRAYIHAMAKGSVALVFAALFGAFAVYMAMWNNDRHSVDYCAKVDQGEVYAQNCGASNEDKNLMLGSGAVAVGLFAFGLIRRYAPSGGRAPEDAATN